MFNNDVVIQYTFHSYLSGNNVTCLQCLYEAQRLVNN